MYSVQLITLLNNLIVSCKDSTAGFMQCADALENPMLKSAYTQHALCSINNARELQALVASLGCSMQLNSTLASNKRWLQGVSDSKAESEVLQECGYGVSIHRQHYQEVLNQQLPPYVEIIVSRQLRAFEARQQQVDSMLEACCASA